METGKERGGKQAVHPLCKFLLQSVRRTKPNIIDYKYCRIYRIFTRTAG